MFQPAAIIIFMQKSDEKWDLRRAAKPVVNFADN